MSEYKRFVAYFYEYIDGKKQKNAGFAKVELRDGLWRVLFRLTSAADPMVPAQVYGFVRENGYLLGIPLGMLNGKKNGNENGNEYGKEGRLMENPPQEWAWSAREPVGTGKYTFDQLNGIYVQSGDGRTFATVWDDETVDPGRFVLELPGAEMDSGKRTEIVPRQAEVQPKMPGAEEPSRRPEGFPQPSEIPPEEPPQPSEIPPEEPPQPPEAPSEEPPQPTEVPAAEPSQQPEEPPQPSEVPTTEPPQQPEELPHPPEKYPQEEPGVNPSRQPEKISQPEIQPSENPAEHHQEFPEPSENPPGEPGGVIQPEKINRQQNQAEMLLRSRQHFRPFQDDELTDCVQIRICDLTLLQQSGWPVGRNNFLQHGYYQYRHLLFGRSAEGDYVLGVPSVYSPREEYMAGVFGYNQFKLSSQYNCGRKFGYWYRLLKKEKGK